MISFLPFPDAQDLNTYCAVLPIALNHSALAIFVKDDKFCNLLKKQHFWLN